MKGKLREVVTGSTDVRLRDFLRCSHKVHVVPTAAEESSRTARSPNRGDFGQCKHSCSSQSGQPSPPHRNAGMAWRAAHDGHAHERESEPVQPSEGESEEITKALQVEAERDVAHMMLLKQ